MAERYLFETFEEIIFIIAPPEVAGNSAPGCVIISILSMEFANKSSDYQFSSLEYIFNGLPSKYTSN